MWNAPIGHELDLGQLPAPHDDTGFGLDAVGPVLDLVRRHLAAGTEPGSSGGVGHLESLTWHNLPGPGHEDGRGHEDGPGPRSDLRFGLRVVDRFGAAVVVRLHGVDPAGEVRVAADLRLRRTSGSGARQVGLLRVPVRAGDSIRRTYPIEAHMLTHHIPNAAGVLMTPNLIALMEETAADIVRPRLAAGVAAVGTWIGVRHTGAAVVDERLDIDAVVVRTHGRRITFDVLAHVGTRRVGDGQIGFTLMGPGHH